MGVYSARCPLSDLFVGPPLQDTGHRIIQALVGHVVVLTHTTCDVTRDIIGFPRLRFLPDSQSATHRIIDPRARMHLADSFWRLDLLTKHLQLLRWKDLHARRDPGILGSEWEILPKEIPVIPEFRELPTHPKDVPCFEVVLGHQVTFFWGHVELLQTLDFM